MHPTSALAACHCRHLRACCCHAGCNVAACFGHLVWTTTSMCCHYVQERAHANYFLADDLAKKLAGMGSRPKYTPSGSTAAAVSEGVLQCKPTDAGAAAVSPPEGLLLSAT